MAGTPIPSLRGTPMHVTAVELYQAHHGGPAGACVRCGLAVPCPVRQHAAQVIAAAGEDPRWYDGRLMPPAPPAVAAGSARPAPGPVREHDGFAVGGRARGPVIAEGERYEREQW